MTDYLPPPETDPAKALPPPEPVWTQDPDARDLGDLDDLFAPDA